jgi:protein phosphatase
MDSSEADRADFKAAFRAILDSFPQDALKYASGQIPMTLPRFSQGFLVDLFAHGKQLFAAEPIMLRLSAPLVIIGDLHGQLLDLVRIFAVHRDPEHYTFLFLGDLIDRGEFSIEVLTTVLLFKAAWPTRVFVIRGNHEFGAMGCQFGFLRQCTEAYTRALFDAAVEMFAYLPVAAIIDDQTLCLHGGLGPHFTSPRQISALPKRIEEFGNPVIDAILWSDPSDTVDRYRPSEKRGVGYEFGADAVDDFLRHNHIHMIIRGHECVRDGGRYSCDRQVLTVFSASNYGQSGNQGAIAELSVTCQVKLIRFEPLPILRRADVNFVSTSETDGKHTKVWTGQPRGTIAMALESIGPLKVRRRRAKFSRSDSALPRLCVAEGGERETESVAALPLSQSIRRGARMARFTKA